MWHVCGVLQAQVAAARYSSGGRGGSAGGGGGHTALTQAQARQMQQVCYIKTEETIILPTYYA